MPAHYSQLGLVLQGGSADLFQALAEQTANTAACFPTRRSIICSTPERSLLVFQIDRFGGARRYRKELLGTFGLTRDR